MTRPLPLSLQSSTAPGTRQGPVGVLSLRSVRGGLCPDERVVGGTAHQAAADPVEVGEVEVVVGAHDPVDTRGRGEVAAAAGQVAAVGGGDAGTGGERAEEAVPVVGVAGHDDRGAVGVEPVDQGDLAAYGLVAPTLGGPVGVGRV